LGVGEVVIGNPDGAVSAAAYRYTSDTFVKEERFHRTAVGEVSVFPEILIPTFMFKAVVNYYLEDADL
jgi:hypothetical protein